MARSNEPVLFRGILRDDGELEERERDGTVETVQLSVERRNDSRRTHTLTPAGSKASGRLPARARFTYVRGIKYPSIYIQSIRTQGTLFP